MNSKSFGAITISVSGSSVNLAHISAHLFFVATVREVPHTYSSPPKLSHQLRQTPIGACRAASQRHLKHVKKGLSTHTLQAIELDLAVDPVQRCQPWIGWAFK